MHGYKVFWSGLLIIANLLLINGCEKLMTQTRSLDGAWQFKYDPQGAGIDQNWFRTDLDRSDWQSETVPGAWEKSGYDGFGWYATTFSYGRLAAGYKLALVFESVDDNAVVWLNGRRLVEHNGWGQLFFVDISALYTPDSVNQLVVRIEDLGGPGGINKEVYLKPYRKLSDIYATSVSKQTAPPPPIWAQNAVIYEVFVRAYSKAGTFRALEADLDRLASLGIDILWLMPIQPLGRLHAKGSYGSPYAVADYYKVNPRMESRDDFKSLVASAHQHGMHLLLDFVLNHSAWDNPLIKQHPDWYTHDSKGQISSPNRNWTDVADFDYSKPGLRKYMLKMLQWWLWETGIDGYRFDVAELMPNDFWNAAKAACRKVKPDVLFLAEGAKPELHLSGQDMTYSWNVWDYLTQVARGQAKVSQLGQTIALEAYQYPKNALRMRFTENHDKPRSRAFLGDSDLNLTAWAFVALMKGDPLIYAGQEIGALRKPGLFEKSVISWAKGDLNLEKQTRDLIRLRKQYIKADSPFKIVMADDKKQVIAYRHGPLVAFFNFSKDPFIFKAHGARTILAGGLVATPSGLILEPKQFGVIK